MKETRRKTMCGTSADLLWVIQADLLVNGKTHVCSSMPRGAQHSATRKRTPMTSHINIATAMALR